MNKINLLLLAGSTIASISAQDSYLNDELISSAGYNTTSIVSKSDPVLDEYRAISMTIENALEFVDVSPKNNFSNVIADSSYFLRQGELDKFHSTVDKMTEKHGKQYDNLNVEDKVSFCILRGVAAFFKGDLINASAFLLETRQLNLTHKVQLKGEAANSEKNKLNLSPLAEVLYSTRVDIDKRAGKKLTKEQETERHFFNLHLTKLLSSKHSTLKIKDPEVFMVLSNLDKDELKEVKTRNKAVYDHSVYLMAQYVVGKMLAKKEIQNIEKVENLIIENLGVFKGMNKYREFGQRLYLSYIQLNSHPTWDTQIIENLTPCKNMANINIPHLNKCFEAIIGKYTREKPELLDVVAVYIEQSLADEVKKESFIKLVAEVKEKYAPLKPGTHIILKTEEEKSFFNNQAKQKADRDVIELFREPSTKVHKREEFSDEKIRK